MTSVHDVAAAIRERLPGVGDEKLHALLYYAQGHHLAVFGEPLFAEETVAAPAGFWQLDDRAQQAALGQIPAVDEHTPEPLELG